MNYTTPSEIREQQGLKPAQARSEVQPTLANFVKDPKQIIAWTSDVNDLIKLEPESTHMLPTGVKFHTAQLPAEKMDDVKLLSAGLGGEMKPLIRKSPSSPSAGLIHDIAQIKVPVGDFGVLVTSAQTFEELFETERVNKGKVAAKLGKLTSQLMGLFNDYLPDQLPRYVKILGLVADVGGKICAYSAEHEKTSPRST